MTDTEYSAQVIDHFTSPRNPGSLSDASGRGEAGDGKSGEILIQISLRATGDLIEEARFRAFGCSATIASASVTTELLRGCSLREAALLSPEEIESALGGLPESRRYCAEYAARAARAAAEDGLRSASHTSDTGESSSERLA
ncbi:MAG: iron-sulfur cluster assembly scaffold protein [Chloroflexota bacterium]|nr:iron-sulfur cluster assembly scaffold protein [Chloroflexota bacterium]